MKKYLKNYLIILLEVLIITVLLSILSFTDIISIKTYNYLELISLFLIFYFNGKKLGNLTNKHYFFEGLKEGVIFSCLFVVLNIIFVKDLSVKLLIYFLIIILVSILGSMRKSKVK